MTDEEYLQAKGWREPEYDDGPWSHPRRMADGRERWFDLTEAVETQLAEDRAVHNFVRAHSDMHGGYLWPKDGPPDDIEANKPKGPAGSFALASQGAPCTDGRPMPGAAVSSVSDEPTDSGPVDTLGDLASRTWTLAEIEAAWYRAQETGRPNCEAPREPDDLRNSWWHVRGALTGEEV